MKKATPAERFLNRFKSIQSPLFLAIAGTFLLAAFLMTTISLYFTNTTLLETAEESTRKIIEQVNQNIDSYISYMDNITSMIASSGDTHAALFGANADSGFRKRMEDQIQIILRSRPDIRNIGVIRKDGDYLVNVAVKKINPYLDLDTQKWYTDALQSDSRFVLTSSHVQHLLRGERPWVITLSRGIRNFTGGGGIDGVAFVDLKYDVISELCKKNNIGSRSYVFVIDQEGNIVYHPQQQQLYTELQTENIDAIMETQEDTIYAGSGDSRRMYSIVRSEKTGWTVVGSVYTSALLANSRRTQRIYLYLVVVFVILALIVSVILTKNLTSPIQRLRDSMAKVQEGDFSGERLPVTNQNEIGNLTESFNVMTERIQELMDQNRMEQEEKRKSEMRALLSQINPHFLYNTLDSIIWMAEGGKNEEVVRMTSSLARLLRQSVTSSDELVTVESELAHVRSYLTIQQMRYKDKLTWEVQAEPDTLQIRIIRLILQPLVENAIYHGLKVKETGGSIMIRTWREEDLLFLSIRDDGVGMEPEVMEHIFEKHKVNYQSNGVGVYNVQQRIQLSYGPEYGIRYESAPGEGTCACITLPCSEEKEAL